MSNTWFENTRQALQHLELLDKCIVEELFEKKDIQGSTVINDWKIKNLIDQKQAKSLDTLILLTDSDKQKKQEMEILQGTKSLIQKEGRKPDIWVNFYDREKEIKETHKKQSHLLSLPTNTVENIRESIFLPPNIAPEFTGEEANGRFVDMNTLFYEYINMKFVENKEQIDYVTYLRTFDDFSQIEQPVKEREYKSYKKYLQNVQNYLQKYFAKVQPLTDHQAPIKQHDLLFEKEWNDGTLKGWDNSIQTENMTQDELEINPLYCKYCKKLFSNENTHFNHMYGKKHKKAEKEYEKLNSKNNVVIQEENAQKSISQQQENIKKRRKELAYLESLIMRYKELLGDIIEDTMNNIRKKQTQTTDQMENDDFLIEEERKVLDEPDEDEPVYNPKNLPLGWDGKPIPYWLYKLHGLGIEYKCEICGNYSYWGRRAFERHFNEWRHSYGMKCLNIPNTIHFKEITSIEHAIALHTKLVNQQNMAQFKPEVEEQFEDSEGNIMNKKTYLDLKRQGLL